MGRKVKAFVVVAFLALLCVFAFAVAEYGVRGIIDIETMKTEERSEELSEELNMTFLGEWITPSLASITCYHDDNRNVTCYLYRGSQAGGISCIPDKDLF
ncbi:hypothetical protein KAU40_02340 [Candidatus Parcubacteria bacterium]|nr:hypothetical protein [Candidatus Parcubacteria bacterium]